MTLTTEQRKFARKYGLTMNETRTMWSLYSTSPAGYRKVIEFDRNAKTVKGRKKGYTTGIIYFAPGSLSGHNVCTSASAECLQLCLAHEGRARLFDSITEARIRKTLRYFDETESFIASMLHDAFRLMRFASKHGFTPCIRPNGTSDLPKLAWVIADAFPMLQVYDYTKHARPWVRTRANYHLTFSHSGHNRAECLQALENGINVTVIFAKGQPLPATHWGYRVIDGDDSDLRFLDPRGVIVGLTAKGQSTKSAALADASGSGAFIILQ
jgi:hypothetical protein